MSTDAILRLPLPPIADQAVLFLRRLASMQQDASTPRNLGFRVIAEVVWQTLSPARGRRLYRRHS